MKFAIGRLFRSPIKNEATILKNRLKRQNRERQNRGKMEVKLSPKRVQIFALPATVWQEAFTDP